MGHTYPASCKRTSAIEVLRHASKISGATNDYRRKLLGAPRFPSATWNLLAGSGHCGREVSPPAAELVVHADGEQLDIAIVGVDCIATKRRRALAYRKGLVT